MKKIKLASGKYTIVDEDVYTMFGNKKMWLCNKYVVFYDRNLKKVVRLHRQILGEPMGKLVDHINRDPLDNRRKNLRPCTFMENIRNHNLRSNSRYGRPGVTKWRKGWKAQIRVNNQEVYLGCYKNIEDAFEVYEKANKLYFGDFSPFNNITV